MKDLKSDRKSRYTRMVLQDSLIELMKQKPISQITITELCENADVNRSTFYKHYSDQYDLLRKIEDEAFEWAQNSLTNIRKHIGESEAVGILETTLQYIVENSKPFQVLMSERGDIDFQKRLLKLVYQQVDIAYLNDKITDSITNEYYLVFIVNGGIGLIQHWLKNGLNKSAKEIAEIIYRMVVPML